MRKALSILLLAASMAFIWFVLEANTQARLNNGVWIGYNGWLFLNEQEAAARVRSELELRQWRIQLEERRDWLKAQGRDFLVVVAPNKSTVYPEFLPEQVSSERGVSDLAQFGEYLKRYPELNFIDLSAVMKGDRQRQFYFKTDTHWNFEGGFIGYQTIAEKMPQYFRADERLTESNIRRVSRFVATNLNKRIDQEEKEQINFIMPLKKWSFKMQKPDSDLLKQVALRGTSVTLTKITDVNLPRLLVIGDSYLGWIRRYLAQHFSRGIYLYLWGEKWSHEEVFPLDLLREEKPDLVMMLFKESRIGFCGHPYCIAHPKRMTNPVEVRQARLNRLYSESASAGRAFLLSAETDMNGELAIIKQVDRPPFGDSGIWLVELKFSELEDNISIQAGQKEGDGRCANLKEFQKGVIASADRIYFCLDAPKGLQLSLESEGVSIGIRSIESIQAVPFPDLPRAVH